MTERQGLKQAYLEGYKQGSGGLWSQIKARTAERLFDKWYDLNWSESDG